jgi:hypothetical protein
MADRRDTEQLLSSALAPVEPPAGLSDRLEQHLALVAGAAADELADWELSAMRDPRNWVRPMAAMAVGSVAAGALVVVRARQHARSRSGGTRAFERGAREVARGLRRRLVR